MNKVIILSTHLDLHGHRFTKAALEEIALQINRHPLRKMVEHDYSLPPIGKVVSAEVLPYEDGEFVLVGLEELYEENRILEIEGVEYVELISPSDSRPFTTRWEDKNGEEISLSIDPIGLHDIGALRAWSRELDEILDFRKETHLKNHSSPTQRSSLISDRYFGACRPAH